MKPLLNYSFFILLLLSFFLLLKCSFSQNKKSMQDALIRKAVIKHVDFNILTPVNVNCNQFEDYFFNNYKTIEIQNEEEIQKLLFLLSSMEHIDSTYAQSVNTRTLLELYKYDDSVEVICFGNLSIKKKDIIYKNNDDIRNFINQFFR